MSKSEDFRPCAQNGGKSLGDQNFWPDSAGLGTRSELALKLVVLFGSLEVLKYLFTMPSC